MQPHIEERTLTTRGVAASVSFGMLAENSAHIFNILRSQLYSNKVLALLREYGANAWDEHRAAGCPDRPIKVVLPTALEPTLRIRDFGRGLSEDQVFRVYTQYGSSTKREDDVTVGAMGIGSKSAFAYTDSFTVTSWHGGQKSVYQAVLDASNIGTMSLMWRGPCDPSETGIEVSITAKVQDCARFQREAQSLFPFFKPMPEINVELRPLPAMQTVHGGVNDQYGFTAVMGCIPYPIDMDHIRESMPASFHHGGVLVLDIGEVSVAGSRESLEYTPRTIAALNARCKAMFTEIKEQSAKRLADCPNSWAKRLIVRALGSAERWAHPEWWRDSAFALDVPFKAASLNEDNLTDKPPRMSPCRHLHVLPDNRLILKDINRSPIHYVRASDIVLYTKTSNFDAQDEQVLNDFLTREKLDGVPVLRMSNMDLEHQRETTRTTPRASKRLFVLKPEAYTKFNITIPSSNWSETDNTPTADDVRIVLERFQPMEADKPQALPLFQWELETCAKLLNWLGIPLPRVVGYRQSTKHMVDPSTLTGMSLKEWMVVAIHKHFAANPEFHAQYLATRWTQTARSALIPNTFTTEVASVGRGVLERLTAALGADHIITTWFSTYHKSMGLRFNADGMGHFDHIHSLLHRYPTKLVDDSNVASLYEQYPLLSPANHGPNLSCLTKQESQVWLSYIQMVDQHNAGQVPKE